MLIDKVIAVLMPKIERLSKFLKNKTGKDILFIARSLNILIILSITPIAMLVYSYEDMPEGAKYWLAIISGLIGLMSLDNFWIIWYISRNKNTYIKNMEVIVEERIEKSVDKFSLRLDFFILGNFLPVVIYLPVLLSIVMGIQITALAFVKLLANCEPINKNTTPR